MGANDMVGFFARGMAFRAIPVFFGGTLVGSVVPESGNALAYWMGLPLDGGHVFNPLFLTIGIAGIVLACVAGFGKRA